MSDKTRLVIALLAIKRAKAQLLHGKSYTRKHHADWIRHYRSQMDPRLIVAYLLNNFSAVVNMDACITDQFNRIKMGTYKV